MNAPGNSADGLGNAAGGSDRPDFVGPDFAPPPYEQQGGPYGRPVGQDGPASVPAGQPQTPDFPPPGGHLPPAPGPPRSNGAGPQKIILITIAAIAVLAIIATVAALAARARPPVEDPAPSPPKRSSAQPTTPPSPSTEPQTADDELGRGLQRTGLACVRVNDAPVFNHCGAKPGSPFAMLRWLVEDQKLTAFRFYGKAGSSRETGLFQLRLQQLHLAGLDRDDERKIIKAMPRSKKANKTVDVSTTWGEITVTYIEPVQSFQVIGSRAGKPASFDGPSFVPTVGDLTKHLKAEKYSCKADSATLTCKGSSGLLTFYRATGETANFVSSGPRDGPADKSVVDLLPYLLGSDVDIVQPMVVDNLDQPFYLGGADGYLVEINSAGVTIEGVTW